MTMNGILLSISVFNSLSAPTQQEVLRSIGLGGARATASKDGASIEPAPSNLANDQNGEGPVELTVAMVRKLTDKLSDKTLTALKIIARSDSPQFHMKDVIAGTSGAKNYMDLRGVWSALTRRTRRITGDDDTLLIWWIGEPIDDEDGNYVDHLARISPLTYQSLRTHFGF